MLRQTAQSAGLLDASDPATTDGVISEAAANAIDALLEQNLNLPEPSEEACHRYHAAHQNAYRTGERVRVRHILFAVTPGVDVLEREPGETQTFQSVRGAVAMSLRQQAFVTALRQYLRLLAGEATLEGVELDAAATPLLQ